MLGIKQRMTTTYNPMADGQAEKGIWQLLQRNSLAKLVGKNPEGLGSNDTLCIVGI